MPNWGKSAALMLVTLTLTVAILALPLTKAQTNQSLTFSSGLTLYSPLNSTYTSDVVLCNGSFDCPKGYQSSLNYSIDGVDKGGLPWSINPDSIANPYIYTIDGSFQLPQLTAGSHQLSIGITEQWYNNSNLNSPRLINSTSWVNTVYFTISTVQPTSTPSPTPTPTVPELSWVVLLPLFASVLIGVLLGKFRFGGKRIALKGKRVV